MAHEKFIPREKVLSNSYYGNLDKYGDHSDSCFICGRRTKMQNWVHYTNGGYITSLSEEQLHADNSLTDQYGESQGSFPIGPECSKKLPKEFITTEVTA